MLSIFVLLLLTPHTFRNYKISPETRVSEKNIEIQIASIQRNLKNKACLDTKVLILNNTDTIASFFDDWNSWGWYNINFKIKSIDTTYYLNKKDRDWPKNYPSYKTLFPGDTMKLDYLLSYDSCFSAEFDNLLSIRLNNPVSIQVFYRLNKNRLSGSTLLDSLIGHHFIYTRINKKGQSVIIDSLKPPIHAIRTFPTTQLESKEYTLSN